MNVYFQRYSLMVFKKKKKLLNRNVLCEIVKYNENNIISRIYKCFLY